MQGYTVYKSEFVWVHVCLYIYIDTTIYIIVYNHISLLFSIINIKTHDSLERETLMLKYTYVYTDSNTYTIIY